MGNNKSPGSDGLSAEFYKVFWDVIKTYYINSVNHSFVNGQLTQLQKQSILTLIPKPGKNLETLDNWRPLSLLNVDYKIATKTIANRINKVISSVVESRQTGFIKGRFIGENVRTIFETINFLNNNNKPGLLLFADYEKAFDSLDHDFMFKSLKQFNFGTHTMD